jgi:prepilin-type processing-associated H-X9-DG protein
LGIFSLVWLNVLHGKLPRTRSDDPSAGRAVGFCFIPFFNLYWIFFTYRRLSDRIDNERELYGLPRSNLKGMATAACVFQVIPYINFLLGYTLIFPIFAGLLQSSFNQLARQSAIKAPPQRPAQVLPAAPGMPGIAIAAIIFACSIIPIIAILAAMLLPALSKAKARASGIACMNNVKNIALSVRINATDNGDRFPAAARWNDALTKTGIGARLRCPLAPAEDQCDYAFNAKLSGIPTGQVQDPATTVLVFESADGWNAGGGAAMLRSSPLRHNGAVCVGFVDGHAEIIRPSRFAQLRWDP